MDQPAAIRRTFQECFPFNPHQIKPEIESSFVDDDSSIMPTSPSNASNSSTVLEWNRHGEFLSNAMSDFFRRGYEVDTSVTFGGERLIGVHRLLMAAFLPTFKRAVDASDGPLAELNFDYVASSIEDVRALLEFVYTGRATVSDHRLDQLSRLAKDLCFEGLSDAIAVHYRTTSRTSFVDSEPDQEAPIRGLVTVKEEPNYDGVEDPIEDASGELYQREQLDHDMEPEQIIVKMEAPDYQEELSSNENTSNMQDPEEPDSRMTTVIPTDVCSVVVKAATEKSGTRGANYKQAGNNKSCTLWCELCGMKFNSMWDLRIHFRCTHPTDKLYECKKCNFHAISDMELFRHVAAEHKSTAAADTATVVDPTAAVDVAATATTTTTTATTTNTSSAISPASGMFPCDQCGEEFTLPSSLLRHVADVHDILNPYHCLKCPRSFASRYWLAAHVKLKHADKTSVRHKTSSNQTPVAAEQLAGTGNFPQEGKMRCELCNMKFDSKMDLRIHFRCSHPTRKLYVCKKCEFVTVAERRMERHRRGLAHNGFSGGERFSCALCGKEYSMACSLQRHMSRVHGGKAKRFQCRDCPQSFATRYNLTRHISLKHSSRHDAIDEDAALDPSSRSDPDDPIDASGLTTSQVVEPERIDSNRNELNADSDDSSEVPSQV